MSEEIRVDPEALHSFCNRVFQKVGMSAEDAELAAELLVEAELRGIDTHGVMMLPGYARNLQEGIFNPQPNIRVVKESSFHALLDGDFGLGHITSTKAMQLCIERAQLHGFGMAGVRNSTHFGAAAHYTLMAARQNLIGFACTNAPPLIPPPGSNVRTHGGNPMSYAIPAGQEASLVVDMSTLVRSFGRVGNYRREGRTLPLGWALDEDGTPTQDPTRAVMGVPFGEDGHKGFALTLVMDALAGVLTGSDYATTFTPGASTRGCGHLFMAIDPELFMPLEEFTQRMDESLLAVKRAPRLPDAEQIYLPGERGFNRAEERSRMGIPFLPSHYETLEELSVAMGIPFEVEGAPGHQQSRT